MSYVDSESTCHLIEDRKLRTVARYCFLLCYFAQSLPFDRDPNLYLYKEKTARDAIFECKGSSPILELVEV